MTLLSNLFVGLRLSVRRGLERNQRALYVGDTFLTAAGLAGIEGISTLWDLSLRGGYNQDARGIEVPVRLWFGEV
jgi:hypothetical protein